MYLKMLSVKRTPFFFLCLNVLVGIIYKDKNQTEVKGII